MEDLIKKEIRFRSSDSVRMVKGWIYAPKDNIKGIVQISHGMCEHIGRYRHFINDLTKQGYIVCGHDHIGHGESSAPEEYGYFGEKKGYRNLVFDLHYMSLIAKKEYPDLPLFLFGHSMGSFVARLYLSKYSNELSGVILCGTSGPNALLPTALAACRSVIALKGPLYRSPMLDRLAFGAFNQKILPVRTSNDWLTRKESAVDDYLKDPKCTFIFTASGYHDLFEMISLINQPSWYQTLDCRLPVFLISGDMDPVGNYGKGIWKVFRSMEDAGVQDVTMTLYPQARHELLNELNYDEVLSDIVQWLDGHVPDKE